MTQAASSNLIAAIDSGTTRTRLRLWDGQTVVWEASHQAGSRDVAQHGKQVLEAAIRALLAQARAVHSFDRIVASGMITSDVGLLEIPHLTAPASYADLAMAICAKTIPSIGIVHFIPGIKTMGKSIALIEIAQLDVMRGEETEVVGLRDALAFTGTVNFFHAGSHHKLVRTDDHGILGSATALSGELLHALSQNTILASSTMPLASLTEIDHDYWSAGLQTAQQHGFGRAAFCVRIADQLLQATPGQATAFLLGAVASLDLPLIPPDVPLVLYGHRTITQPLSLYLAQRGRTVHTANAEVSEHAATRGAALLLNTSRAPLP